MRVFILLVALLVASADSTILTASKASIQVTEGAPPPEDCTRQPRPLDELVTLVGSKYAPASEHDDTVTDGAAAFATPHGRTADSATVEAIQTTMWSYVACGNAGDYRRFLEHYSDEYLATQLPAFTEDTMQELQKEPSPLPEEYRTILEAVTEVRLLADGRVAAEIETFDPYRGKIQFIAYFIRIGEHWCIDEAQDVRIDPV
jgi:hypothetical protein